MCIVDGINPNVKVFIPQEMNLRFPSFAQVIGIVEYVTQENEIDQIIRRTLDGQEFISKPKVNQIDEDEQQDVETDFDPVADGYDTPRDKKKEDKDKKDVSTETGIKIDLEGITDRIIKLPLPGSYYGNFYSDGEKVWYYGRGGTKVYDLKKQKEDTDEIEW